MTSPKFANDTGPERFYEIDGRKYLSVTNTINILSKPALVPWASKMVAEAMMETDWRMVFDDIMEDKWQVWGEKSDKDPPERSLKAWERATKEEVRKRFSRIPKDYTNRTALFGSAVHWLAEHYLTFEANKDAQSKFEWFMRELGDESLRPKAMSSLEQFREWLERENVQVLEQEITLLNEYHGYAGTCDLLCHIGGRPEVWILDIKTSEKGPYKEAALQMAAYANATHVVRDDGSVVEFDYCPERAGVIKLNHDKCELHEMDIDRQTFDAFLACLELKRWRG